MMMVADTSKSDKDAVALSKELSEIGDKIGVVIRCQARRYLQCNASYLIVSYRKGELT